MTDFFTRLAERALGLALVIQPITASTFEPVKGISIQDDTLDIVLEEESHIEVADRSIRVAATGALSPLDKPGEELVAGALQRLETSAREPVANTLPPLETSIREPILDTLPPLETSAREPIASTLPLLKTSAREPIASTLPPLEKSASVPRASTQEPRNASLPGKYSEVAFAGPPGPRVSVPVDRADGIPPTTTTVLSSQVNEVHVHSEHSAYFQNRLERGEAQRPATADARAPLFPGARPPSAPTRSVPAMRVVSGTSTPRATSPVPIAAPQQLAETAQPSASEYPRPHAAPEHPRTKAGDAQRVVLETHIMQGSPEAKAPHLQQTPFQEEEKRQQPLEHLVSSQPSPARPASAPAIHVTIGRIEVRATPAPAPTAPPPAQRPTSSVMSLDDYLRQRARGGH